MEANVITIAGRADEAVNDGYIDSFGTFEREPGIWFAGWARSLPPGVTKVVARCGATRSCQAVVGHYPRTDLPEGAVGIVGVLHEAVLTEGASLSQIEFTIDGTTRRLIPLEPPNRLREAALRKLMRSLLSVVYEGARGTLETILSREPYHGTETISSLRSRIDLAFDQVIEVRGAGVFLAGWYLDPGAETIGLVLRSSAGHVVPLDSRLIRINRPDVAQTYEAQCHIVTTRLGFIAFCPMRDYAPGLQLYLEIKLRSGEVGFQPLQVQRADPVTAMKRILESFHHSHPQLQAIMDHHVGPALQALSTNWRKRRPDIFEWSHGRVEKPWLTLIVPLYGRIDFVEYQLALFANGRMPPGTELLYVLDDPRRFDDTLLRARLMAGLYDVPFRLLCLSENVGYARANNAGAAHARGETLVLLNSDVFPAGPGSFEALAGFLDRTPGAGVVGPTLLFEDGTIQHAGMSFMRRELLANWWINHHPLKGRSAKLLAGRTATRAPAVTGACLVARRALYLEVGGLSENFIFGDFEDSDFCLKVAERGLETWYLPPVWLFHLERQSQRFDGGTAWRDNASVYNCWQHHRTWDATIGRLMAGDSLPEAR